uniref:catechol O-methyltransferase n=1 Tax=Araucaria cunninghamii TaxID=56994 RepID=A0A0D6QYE2_ARACU
MALAALSTAYSFLKAVFNMNELVVSGQAGDGREQKLVEHVLKTAEKGNPSSVISAIDEYAKNTSWLMNIGDDKGPILDAALQKYNHRVVLELGTFCGYSAVRMAAHMLAPGSKILSFEMSADNCRIARQIIDHAGLSSKVDVVEGKFEDRVDVAKQFLKEMKAPFFDFVFIDHWKNRYLGDYLLLKENGLIGDGSGICADNMGPISWANDFKKYIKTHPEELTDTVEYRSKLEYMRWIPDSVMVSTFKRTSQ